MKQLSEIVDDLKDDLLILKALEKKGDLHELPHVLEYHFISEDNTSIQQLRKLAEGIGLTVANVDIDSAGPNKNSFSINLIINDKLTKEICLRNSILMNALAELSGCVYDGWGTYVVKYVE